MAAAEFQSLIDALTQQRPAGTAAEIARAKLQAQALQDKATGLREHRRLPGAAGWAASINRGKRADDYSGKAQNLLVEALSKQAGIDGFQQQMARLQELQDYSIKQGIEAGYRQPSELEAWMGSSPEEQARMVEFYAGKRAPGVTVNTGNADFVQNPDGTVTPRVGGAEWYKREQDAQQAAAQEAVDAEKRTGRTTGIQRAGSTVVQDLGRALELVPDLIDGDGVVGANARLAASKLPGTAEFYANQFIESAKSNIGLDRIQQMRDNSETGGALGQVPIQQQKRLEQVLGNFDMTMPKPMLVDNMHRVQNIYTDIMYGSPAERALAVEQERMTQEESDRIDTLYHELSFDDYGRKKNPEQTTQGQGEPNIFINPKTNERIKWDGTQWVRVK